MRIHNHPILGEQKDEDVTIVFDGKKYEAKEGETVAATLMANGIRQLGRSRKMNQSRGVFCANGRCCSCFVSVDGLDHVLACQTHVCDGMEVQSSIGDPDVRGLSSED